MTTRSVFLTAGQAAQQLGISRRTLGRAVDRGELPCARHTPGGRSLFLPTDVDTLAQRLSVPLTAAHPRAGARIHDRPAAAAPTALLSPEREGHATVALAALPVGAHRQILADYGTRRVDLSCVPRGLALFYYDDDQGAPGSYIIYKVAPVQPRVSA